jgi:hypothetical protein
MGHCTRHEEAKHDLVGYSGFQVATLKIPNRISAFPQRHVPLPSQSQRILVEIRETRRLDFAFYSYFATSVPGA